MYRRVAYSATGLSNYILLPNKLTVKGKPSKGKKNTEKMLEAIDNFAKNDIAKLYIPSNKPSAKRKGICLCQGRA